MVGGEELRLPAGAWASEQNCGVRAQQRHGPASQIAWAWVVPGLPCTTSAISHAGHWSGLHGQALPEASQALLGCWC